MISQCPSSVVRRPSFVVRRAASTIAFKAYSSCILRPMDSNLVDQKQLKSFRSEILDGFENLFFASTPESKGQSTRNLVGSIEVTGRAK